MTFAGALQHSRDALAAGAGTGEGDSAWGSRFFNAGEPRELVGWGGFKGPPRDGFVELGDEIAEARRGRGLATEATRPMVAEALADPAVDAAIAHTLPEPNASSRVLEKAGFSFNGDAEDRGEPVWRYTLARVDAAADRP